MSIPTFSFELCPFVILHWQLYPPIIFLYGGHVPSITLKLSKFFLFNLVQLSFIILWYAENNNHNTCYVGSFFPRNVLDEILDLIESVSEGFSTYICLLYPRWLCYNKDDDFNNKRI